MALPAPSEQDLARYDGYYRQLDTQQTGKISKAQAAPLLNRAGLEPIQLARLWAVADTDGDDHLNITEFRTAMHIATLALQGHPGAQGMLRGEAAEIDWALDEADVMRYDGYFRMLETNGSTHVNQQQAKPLFDRAGLAPEALAQVWLLADADKDGMLSQAEFRCAMHLATLAVQGEPLPRQLPSELARTAGLPGAAAAGRLGTITDAERAQSRSLYMANTAPGDAGMSGSVAHAVLSRSQLPNDDLAHIWELADTDADGMLDLHEFGIAMHLVLRRTAGDALPDELPASLLKPNQPPQTGSGAAEGRASPSLMAAGAVAALAGHSVPFGANAAAARGAASDRWAMKPSDRKKYSEVFMNVLGAAATETVGGAEAHRFLARSRLPNDELGDIWELADVDGDGRFSLDEFCVAMHLVSRRVAGDELPTELPASLRPAAPRWEPTPEQRFTFGAAFETIVGPSGSRMTPEQARRHMMRSGLPAEVPAKILQLVAPGGGKLSEEQFCLAMSLITRAMAGTKLPEQLPDSLRKQVEAQEEPPLVDVDGSVEAPAPTEPQPARGAKPAGGGSPSSKLAAGEARNPEAARRNHRLSISRGEKEALSLQADLLSLVAASPCTARAPSTSQPEPPLAELSSQPAPPADAATEATAGGASAESAADFERSGSGDESWLLVPPEADVAPPSSVSSMLGLAGADAPGTTAPGTTPPPAAPTSSDVAAAIGTGAASAEASDGQKLERLKAEVAQLQALQGELHTAQLQVVSRQHEADDMQQRIAAVEAQRLCCQREYEACLKTLQSLRGQCEEYAVQLRQRQGALQAAQAQLEKLGGQVGAAETQAASQLDSMQATHVALHAAREEVAKLKEAQFARLRDSHLSSRSIAPVRSELAQLQAEVAALRQQLEAPLPDAEVIDGTAEDLHMLEMEVDTARLQRQQLQDELHARQQERRKRHDEQQKDIHLKRGELARIQQESAQLRTAVATATATSVAAAASPTSPSRSDSSPPLQSAQSMPSSHGAFGFGEEERPRMRSRTPSHEVAGVNPFRSGSGSFVSSPPATDPAAPVPLEKAGSSERPRGGGSGADVFADAFTSTPGPSRENSSRGASFEDVFQRNSDSPGTSRKRRPPGTEKKRRHSVATPSVAWPCTGPSKSWQLGSLGRRPSPHARPPPPDPLTRSVLPPCFPTQA